MHESHDAYDTIILRQTAHRKPDDPADNMRYTNRRTTMSTGKKKQPPKTAKGVRRKSSETQPTASTRQLQLTSRDWRKPRTWRAAHAKPASLPKARHILKAALQGLKSAPRPLLGITAIYGLGMLLLVRGFSASQDIMTVKTLLDSLVEGAGGKAQSTLVQLSFLFSSGNTASSAEASVYRTIFLVVCSLAFIWAFRQIYAKKTVTTKRAFYRGMTPLIPFLLVLGIIGIQLLPLTTASLLYNNLIGGGLAVQAWEQIVTFLLCLLLLFWSLRMLTGSVIALYIVTLPDMTPLAAIRSAKQLVRYRRLHVWRKYVFLCVTVIICTSIAVLPFLLFLTPLAAWVFFLVSTFWVPFIHSYLYQLYRKLLT